MPAPKASRYLNTVRDMEARTNRYAKETAAGGAQTLALAGRLAAEPATFPPPKASPLAQVEASLLALLTASELHEPSAPAAKAYRASMRARAQDAAAAGGAEALDYLLARIRAADPGKADVREAILETAWSGLPGWRQ